MTPSPFHKRLLIKIGIASAVIAVLSVAVIFLNKNLNGRVDEIDKLKAEIIIRTRTIDLIAGGNNDLKRAEPLVARLQTVIPEKDELVKFSREVARLGKENGVNLGFSFNEGEVAATATEAGHVPFTLSIIGPYDGIVASLQALERHPYFVRFESVTDLSYDKDGLYNLHMNGSIYFFSKTAVSASKTAVSAQ
jgi:hypothetical protein